MIEGHNIEEELLLMNDDFPDYFIDKAHPSDYISFQHPTPIEFIYHKKQYHNRIIARVSWLVGCSFVPMSFVIDTGAPNGFYLSHKAFQHLQPRIQIDDMDNQYVCIKNSKNQTKNIMVCPTPYNHSPANIIGLKILMFLGMEIHTDETICLPLIPDYL